MTPTRAARVSSLRSMTGFGRAEVSAGPVAISVEARSLNHRHLDVTLRLPRALADLEMDARRLIQSRLERGRVEIAAQLSPAPDTPGQKISVDQALDRKSTRLNSSHGYISYAVFCLKKKKNNNHTSRSIVCTRVSTGAPTRSPSWQHICSPSASGYSHNVSPTLTEDEIAMTVYVPSS